MRSRLTRGLALAAAAAALFALLPGCEEKPEFPRELLGTWSSTTKPYADRVMIVEPEQVRFGPLAGALDSFPISGVVPPVEGGDGSCRITYLDREGGEHTLFLIYEDHGGGRLRLRNRPGAVWTRLKLRRTTT